MAIFPCAIQYILVAYLFIYFLNLFIYLFWLRWVLIAAHGLSLVAASGGHSSLWCTGFSLWWLLLLRSTGSRRAGFSRCDVRAPQLWLVGSRAQAQQLWRTGLVALWHVGSSRTRHRTPVPCIGRWILNHWVTREVPSFNFRSQGWPSTHHTEKAQSVFLND